MSLVKRMSFVESRGDEVLHRLSWKCAILAYYSNRLARIESIPRDFIDEPGLITSQLYSGGYYVCELMEKLRILRRVSSLYYRDGDKRG